MKTAFLCIAAVAGLMLVGSTQAEAGHRCGRGGFGFGYRGHIHRGFYGRQYRSFYNYPSYHDTSHFDYHGPSLQRHYNHYHYVPGHYDFHRSGHYHF